ncbi:Hypothetical protein NCS54_00697200 [Fusarium falciforme]|uniref:Hypothetical protein n=1 Tax=Fusarium falciforme TaxID=195108 RepID=UPI002300FD00|nr:Hypothetical protein NCS54_00697200 [Fusarium falciforme]WAO89578.1 Hypothetical protein NCS54_00697200 [Fusarium falciforme]
MSTTQNAGPSWLAPYEVCHGLDTVRRRQAKLERHEILHHLRGSLEEHHRNQLETFQIHHTHLLKDMSHIGEIMGLNCWNKTVPIFLLKGPAGRAGYPEMLRPTLHNYLYRRWFRPYRTDRPAVQDEDAAVEMTMSMHGTVCSNFDSRIPTIKPEKQQYYITRPLFRAMAIAIQGKVYSRCYDSRPLSYMPVLIILTSQDDGLSAPITFDSNLWQGSGSHESRNSHRLCHSLGGTRGRGIWSTARPGCLHGQLMLPFPGEPCRTTRLGQWAIGRTKLTVDGYESVSNLDWAGSSVRPYSQHHRAKTV